VFSEFLLVEAKRTPNREALDFMRKVIEKKTELMSDI
jgi:hypothetical protein